MKNQEFDKMLSEIGPKGVIEHFLNTSANKETEAVIEFLRDLMLNPGNPETKNLLTAMMGPKAVSIISSFNRTFSAQDRSGHIINLMSAIMRMNEDLSKEQRDALLNASIDTLAEQDADAMADE